MAYRNRSRGRRSRIGGGAGQKALYVLGTFVGLGIALWVYSQVLDAIVPTINDSSYFGATTTFILAIVPVVGIVAAYKIVKPLFTQM
jgi:uncharacterized membrane protein